MAVEEPVHSFLSPGQKLGKYEIKALLGRGGMAEVYRARNPDLNQDVAIKVLHPSLDDKESAERFRREAQSIAALSHPNIIRVYDFDTTTTLFFMVMELINGPSLRQIISDAPNGLLPHEALRLFRPLAEAVGYAHRHGIVHRDIKPGNVLLADGTRPVLTDFGLARIVGGQHLTATGQTAGTPAYMSPEQVGGLPVGPTSDIYSLGVLLYEMLSGDVPFKGDSFVTIAIQHMQSPPPPLRSRIPTADPVIDAAIQKALAKTPEERFQTTDEFLAALDSATPVAVPPVVAVTLAERINVAAQPTIQMSNVTNVPLKTRTARHVDTYPSPARPRTTALGLGILVGAAVAVAAIVLIANRGTPNSPVAPTVALTPTAPAGMVYIPGGTFLMGTDSGATDQKPAHDVTLSPYLIDKTDVTNADYQTFLNGNGLYKEYLPLGWTLRPAPWNITASSGFAAGDPLHRWSYDGKEIVPLNNASLKIAVDSDKKTGEVDVEFDADNLAYQVDAQGQLVTGSGHWKIVHNTFDSSEAFFQDGIGANITMHGDSGHESPYYPTMTTSVATWGWSDVYLNGKLLSGYVKTHVMYSKGVRTQSGQILRAPGACCYSPSTPSAGYIDPSVDQVEFLLLPVNVPAAYSSTPTGPTAINTSVPPPVLELYFTNVNVQKSPDLTPPLATYPTGQENFPVTGITWDAAQAYCQSLGKRLPTEAEWEHAARGPNNTRFPWGDTNMLNNVIPANWSSGTLQAVNSYPQAASGYGVEDMAGNAWQWVQDWYQPDYYQHPDTNNPQGPTSGQSRVIRGGGDQQLGESSGAEYSAVYRLAQPPDKPDSSIASDISFRCAQPVAQSPTSP